MVNIGKLFAKRIRGRQAENKEETLTAEQVLQINVNGQPYSITMRTPGNERELVRGLLHSEDATREMKNEFHILTSCIDEHGAITAVDVALDSEEIGPGLHAERSLVSVSSCGMCGKKDMNDISLSGKPLETRSIFDPAQIENMFEHMAREQVIFSQTGGSHASAAFTPNGEILGVMEDIGRHNAVDKVIGKMLLNGTIDKAEVLLVSGRVSYEIISKAYKAGIPFLAAVSAPSTLAVELSDKLGITLMAFCRGDKMTVYSHSNRVILK